MRLLLVLLCAMTAASARAQSVARIPDPVPCQREDATCREDCTIEFGASFRQREKLGRCLRSCERRQDTCTRRWRELHLNAAKPRPAPAAPRPEAAAADRVAGASPPASTQPTDAGTMEGATEVAAPAPSKESEGSEASESAEAVEVAPLVALPTAEAKTKGVGNPDAGAVATSTEPDDGIRLPTEEQLRGPPGTKAGAAASTRADQAPASGLQLPKVFD